METREVPRAVFDRLTDAQAVLDLGPDEDGRPICIGPLSDSRFWLRWTGDHPSATPHKGSTALTLFGGEVEARADDRGESFFAMVASSHVDGWHSHPRYAVFKVINFMTHERRITRQMTFRIMQALSEALSQICEATAAICEEHRLEPFRIMNLELGELERGEATLLSEVAPLAV